MKHLKEFDKDIERIKDILLEFVDNSSIILTGVKRIEPNEIRITFTINTKYRGQERIDFVNNLLNKIRRRYPYIKISGQNIFIYLEKNSGKNYITSVEEKVISKAKKIFYDSFKIESEDYTTFVNNKSRTIVGEFHKKTNKFYYARMLIIPYDTILVSEDSQNIILSDFFENNECTSYLNIIQTKVINDYKEFYEFRNNPFQFTKFNNGTITSDELLQSIKK